MRKRMGPWELIDISILNEGRGYFFDKFTVHFTEDQLLPNFIRESLAYAIDGEEAVIS